MMAVYMFKSAANAWSASYIFYDIHIHVYTCILQFIYTSFGNVYRSTVHGTKLDNSIEPLEKTPQEENELEALSPPRHDTTQYRSVHDATELMTSACSLCALFHSYGLDEHACLRGNTCTFFRLHDRYTGHVLCISIHSYVEHIHVHVHVKWVLAAWKLYSVHDEKGLSRTTIFPWIDAALE